MSVDTASVVVEVNEGVVEATGRGVEWWLLYSRQCRSAGRLRETTSACIVGGKIEVLCDDRDHAEWLVGHMVDFGGLPASAVRVKRPTTARRNR